MENLLLATELMIKTAGVHGGLRIDARKQKSTSQPIRQASLPQQAILPLDQHAGSAAAPVVAVGEKVLRGQLIARSRGEISACLHAPISGTVVALEMRPAPHRLGAPTLSIVIDSDGRDEQFTFPQRSDSYQALDRLELCEFIDSGGIVGLGGAAFPTSTKLLHANTAADMHLLLNGAECEPYISCDHLLMRERAADVVLGAQILMHAVGANRCTIAIEDDTPDAERALRAAIKSCAEQRIDVVIVSSIYPAGGERQLIAAVAGVEVPHDGWPTDIGLVCQNVGTAAAVARWWRDGEPLISRIVTVTGEGVGNPCNLEVRLGTPVSSVVADCGGYTSDVVRLIMGGSMMGAPLPHDDLPVVKATNCIVAATPHDLHPRGMEMPCIRCGDCSDVCPAMLLPQQLHWYLQPPNFDALESLGLMDCIECGCCDYVCPSKIPLAERFRDAKPALAVELAARGDASAARSRFEARNARLAEIEADRRAKLEEKRRQLLNRKP